MTTFVDSKGRLRSLRTNSVVCRCRRGYGSEYDGKCYRCRGNVTAWEQKKMDSAGETK